MKLFGYKRWYKQEVKNEQGKSYLVKKKLKKDNYQILISKDNKKVEEDIFIKKLKNYKIKKNEKCEKRNELEIIGKKFSKNNILFKIKEKEFRNISILKQSESLGEFNKENNTGKNTPYRRDNYENIISNNSKSNNIEIGTIKIFIFDDENKYNESKNKFKILYRINSSEENEIRTNIYQKCKDINNDIFNILKILVSKQYNKRNFEDYYIYQANGVDDTINEIFENLKMLKKICSNNEKMYKELKFYLNIAENNSKVSDIKKLFASKLENYFLYDVELKKGDLLEFLVKEAIFYDILKREEKNPEKVNDYLKENWKNVWIKTYIKNDKHNSYLDNGKNEDTAFLEKVKESEKIKTIQELLGRDIKDTVENIFKLYKIDILVKKLKKEKINDTNLFGIYKTHYKENVKKEMENYIKIKNDEKDNCKKLIAKIIYRYIKGRIEKIITYKCKDELDEIFKKDILKEKIIKRVEQYIIENLIYLGKVKLLNEDKKGTLNDKNIAKEFEIFSIKEELELEFLNFVSATNLKLNELFKKQKNERATFDYFANIKEKVDNHFKALDIAKSKTILKNRLNIDVDNFKTYLEIMTSIRSKIIHRGNSTEDNISIFDYYKTFKKISSKLEKDYENVIKKINELKISDEEICKNLNFDILFNNEKIKSVLGKINNIEIGNTNTIYFPSYSKLVPRIESELRETVYSKNFNDREFSILKNAFIYLNKVLYYKTISNWKEDKEEEYKNAQIRVSKGDKKAIKKFQNKFINEYLEKIKIEYKNLFNFDYLENIETKIFETKVERKLDKNYILNSESKSIKIKNDFEYIIIVSALIMSDNTYINKFRNRLFSTFTALESMNTNIENLNDIQNLIEILDIIIAINKEKRDYKNEQLLNSSDKINKIKKEIENLKIEIQNITLTEEDYICIVECCKDNLFSNKNKLLNNIKKICNERKFILIDLFAETDNKIIQEYFSKNNISKEDIGTIIAFNREIKNIKIKVNSNKLHTLLLTSSEKNIDNLLRKEQLLLNKEKLVLELESSKEILNKYIEKMEEIIKDDKEDKRKFEELYYQKNNALIYKKNLFYYINQDSFQEIYDKFLKDDLENVSTSKLKNNTEIVKKIDDVNKILTDINNYIHGFSKEYKENFAKNIENFFKKRKYNTIETFKKFEEIYNEVKEYKKDKEVIEMETIGKLMNYLVEINWKLAMQISRIERDIDYLYNGVIIMDPKLEIEDKDAKLRLNKVLEYCKTKQNGDIFKSLEELKIDLETEKNKNENSTRNIVAHFELLQTPFKNDDLIEIINKVSKLSEYRTRYNSAVYNSCFEVFKRDFDLNYENLKKRFKLSYSSSNDTKGTFKIKDILSPKKVSILNLEENNELLVKVEKFFEYKIKDLEK